MFAGVCAALMAVASPALALSGNSSSGNAAIAQYTPSAGHGGTGHGHGGGTGKNGHNGNGHVSANGNATASVSPTDSGNTQATGDGTQPSSASLPFTGYAVLAALGIGVVMLSIGALVRRRSGSSL